MNLKKNYINILVVFSIFLLDRISKLFVIYLDKKSSFSQIFSSKFLNIQLIWNEGIAFGLFSFREDIFYNLLSILILFLILVIMIMIKKSQGIKKFALLMVLGGALGNFTDRLLNKAVPDFIDFHIGNFHWFIFNVADIFITIGIIFMIVLEFTNNKKKA